jgi:hypothetical protein
MHRADNFTVAQWPLGIFRNAYYSDDGTRNEYLSISLTLPFITYLNSTTIILRNSPPTDKTNNKEVITAFKEARCRRDLYEKIEECHTCIGK